MGLLSDCRKRWSVRQTRKYELQVKALESDGFYKRFLDNLSLDLESKKILEVGPGFGCWMRALRQFNPSELVGVDISELYLDKLRKDGFKVLQADACNLPFADNTFDFVLCYLVIYCVQDEQRALNELIRVTKPGGSIFVSLHGMGFYLRRLLTGKIYSIYPLGLGGLKMLTGRKLGHTFQIPARIVESFRTRSCEVLKLNVPTFLGTPKIFSVLARKTG